MLNFFQMCDLLEKNKLHEGDDYENFLAALTKMGAKTKKPEDAASAAASKIVQPEPQPVVSSVPATDVPKASDKPVVRTQSPQGDDEDLSFHQRMMRDNPNYRQRYQQKQVEKLYGKDRETTQGHIRDRIPGFNQALLNPAYRFYTILGLETLKLPFELFDYTQSQKNPIVKRNEMPPLASVFRILFDRMERDSSSPDYEVIMAMDDVAKLNRFVKEKLSLYEGRPKIHGESLLTFLLAPAQGNLSFGDEAKLFRAAEFENFILRPQFAGLETSVDALAAELGQLASRGGLGAEADDVEALKYLIKTAQKNKFDFFEVNGDLDDPSTTIRVKSSEQLGRKVGAEDKADSASFKRGIGKEKDLMRKLQQGAPLFKPQAGQNESTEWDDIMDLMEYWQY
jgi:hypothetical protein